MKPVHVRVRIFAATVLMGVLAHAFALAGEVRTVPAPAELVRRIIKDEDPGTNWMTPVTEEELTERLVPVQVADLTPGGVKGYFVVAPEGSGQCGSGGCGMWIYRQTPRGFDRLFGGEDGVLLPHSGGAVQILSGEQNRGYFGIRLEETSKLRFDGRQYRLMKPGTNDYESANREFRVPSSVTDPGKVAQSVWRTRIAKCGDVHVAAEYNGYDQFEQIYAYRGVEFQLAPESLSDADRANGIEWRGLATIRSASRRFYQPNGDGGQWSPWTESSALAPSIFRGENSFRLEKVRGKWGAESNGLAKFQSIDCSTIPE